MFTQKCVQYGNYSQACRKIVIVTLSKEWEELELSYFSCLQCAHIGFKKCSMTQSTDIVYTVTHERTPYKSIASCLIHSPVITTCPSSIASRTHIWVPQLCPEINILEEFEASSDVCSPLILLVVSYWAKNNKEIGRANTWRKSYLSLTCINPSMQGLI